MDGGGEPRTAARQELEGGCRRLTSSTEDGGERRARRRPAELGQEEAPGAKRGRPPARRRERWIWSRDDPIDWS
jgi:hypothetical protein